MPTLNEFLEKALKDQPINEAVGGLEPFVDNFIRVLIGDKKVALNYLKSMNPPKFSIPDIGDEYNKMYANLFKDVLKAFQKNLK